MLRRCAFVLLALVPPTVGCFFAFPAVSRCPGGAVPASDEVVAFAVRAQRWQHGTAPIPEEVHTLRRVELDGGEAAPQFRPYLARGYFFTAYHEYPLTKLYRRGYKTVTLDSHRESAQVTWEAAPTLDEQEAAVRDLLYHARPGLARTAQPELAPGSSDPRHREALAFAAGELDRIGALHPPGSEAANRCRLEADGVRKRAAE